MIERVTLRWICRDRILEIGPKPLVMGILNVTPDSFSDGGQYVDTERAVAHGMNMVEDGADMIDVGGESTRPGAAPVSDAEEIARIEPVIRELTAGTDALISIDTRKAEVARQALAAGAHVVNDVSAMTHDPAMPGVAAEYRAGVVLMHMRGAPQTMQENPRYGDVVVEVREYLAQRVNALAASGLERGSLAVDPGIGFGKTVEHNKALLAGLDALLSVGVPIVVGLSRKSFLGKITGREVNERLPASLAAMIVCLENGAHVMRVHDVRESVDAVAVWAALRKEERTNHDTDR
ncbi:MAG: dihydropteroate synthase [Lentisphaerae bacterium]|nr:dihydropteroate synthase [Lentisphaerota bacterium]